MNKYIHSIDHDPIFHYKCWGFFHVITVHLTAYFFWLMRGKKMIERTEKKMQNPGLLFKRFKRVDLAYILEQIKLLVW